MQHKPPQAPDTLADMLARFIARRILAVLETLAEFFAAWSQELAAELAAAEPAKPAGSRKLQPPPARSRVLANHTPPRVPRSPAASPARVF
jgi:hypothetical protein